MRLWQNFITSKTHPWVNLLILDCATNINTYFETLFYCAGAVNLIYYYVMMMQCCIPFERGHVRTFSAELKRETIMVIWFQIVLFVYINFKKQKKKLFQYIKTEMIVHHVVCTLSCLFGWNFPLLVANVILDGLNLGWWWVELYAQCRYYRLPIISTNREISRNFVCEMSCLGAGFLQYRYRTSNSLVKSEWSIHCSNKFNIWGGLR